MSSMNYQEVQVDLKNETLTVGGVVYTASVANEIAGAYERMCTANFLIDTYSFTEEKAWKMADKVRDIMADNPQITEEEAIDIVMDEDEEDYE